MATHWLNKINLRSAFHLQSGFLSPCTWKSWVEVKKITGSFCFYMRNLCMFFLFYLLKLLNMFFVAFLQLWGRETSFKWKIKFSMWSFGKSNRYHWTLWYHGKTLPVAAVVDIGEMSKGWSCWAVDHVLWRTVHTWSWKGYTVLWI